MSPAIIFVSEMSVISVGAIFLAVWYVWPKLKNMSASAALIPLLFASLLRVAALGLANPGLTDGASSSAHLLGYGDFVSAILALIAIFFLRKKGNGGIGAAWLYVIVGTLDLLFGFKVIGVDNLLVHLGAFSLIAFLTLPTLFISTILIWMVLIKNPRT